MGTVDSRILRDSIKNAKNSEENTLTCELCEADERMLLCRLKGAEPHSDGVIALLTILALRPERMLRKIER